ncbi:MAG: molecular chaperone DnaK [Candidatus Rokubacteria bacterium 13_1_40CM_69_27]|nr:MAG: molecular chaperone DnaK [Candidatus Rokubacteria bacterium 13_1_40CM_69_27]OLC39165.1 MAG: molecular chaperone DnaK [Candidatus Rokubacteria bacterium 13_1_40CM_4_69_5]
MSRIIGIDLGTTNSLVAYVDEETGLPRVIPDAEGRMLLPSVVAFTPAGILVGEAAKRQLARRPQSTVYSVKRFMGRGYEDVKDELRYFPFAIRPADGIVRLAVGGHEVTPPEVSAVILRSLKERAEGHFGEPLEKAVITVPAYFNDSQRQATRDAGRIAGLDVVRIVNEPTAASLAYGLHRLREGVVAVYDLGGGTFDISILRVKDGIFEVLATNGDTHLGGDDFDRVLMLWLLEDIQARHHRELACRPVDLGHDSEVMQELRLAAEAAKIRLSAEERTRLVIPFEDFTYHREITRAELERLVNSLVEKTLGPCRMALADAGLRPDQIDEVVLVGGSTRIPLVRRRVQELFGQTPHSQLNPDEVVALGAAVQAHILAGGITNMLLLDVTPLSLGIETLGGVVSVLIARNTTIPTSAREMFTTSVDGQTVVDMHVVQGERELAKDCRSLARFELRGVDPMPAGMPKIEVTFLIDANGILNVTAKELRTGKAASIEVKPTYGLSETDVGRMVEESFQYAEADVEARMLIEVRNEADTVMTHVRRALKQAGDLVSAEERQRVTAALEALARARETSEPDLIRETTTELNRATEHLAEVMMDTALRQALGSQRAAEIMAGGVERGEHPPAQGNQ